MPQTPSIGFIGFGEAGYHIGKGLREADAASIFAYDIAWRQPGRGERIRRRAEDAGITLVGSPAELARNSDVLLSLVTAASAAEAASQNAPFLRPNHIYADLNSVSPALKRRIAETISAAGSRYVEAAILAPVPPQGHRVPILVNGPHEKAFVEQMAPLGMRLEALSAGIGAAAAVKMCRSIVVKGLEALLLECVLGASRYGAEERVFASLAQSYPGMQWKELAWYMIDRVFEHGERRAREMNEVADTLRAAGIEPIMSEAAAARQDWRRTLGIAEGSGPRDARELVELLRQSGVRETED